MSAALLLCTALSAFFSASETAYAASSPIRLKTMQQAGNKKAGAALALTQQYDRLLTAILVGNNVVNIAGTAIATVLFTGLCGDAGPTISTAVMTIIILLFGEIAPKTVITQSPERFAMRTAGALRVLMALLLPIDRVFALWRALLSRVFRGKADEADIEAELMTMVDEAESGGDMDSREGELIRSAITFDDQVVTDIMTPRVDITALDDTATCEEAEELFRTTAYSRIPVCHEDLDHVTGILNEKDFHSLRHEGVTDITRMMQEPVFAPSSLNISRLLKLFQSTKSHLVVVLDEFGGTEGIVTMEDVLEELVGEIYDEHDDVTEALITRPDGSMLVEGSMQLDELLEELHLENTYEADTVGGWAAEVLGRIPSVGSHFVSGGLQCTVVAMDRRRVLRVRLRRVDPGSDEA